jgi:hypothetical protein
METDKPPVWVDNLRVLAIGRDEAIVQVVARLVNSHPDWTGVAVTTDEEAVAAFGQERFHIVLLGGGITAREETALKERLSAIDASAVVVRHYGGGSGLLENEIRSVMDEHHIQIVKHER